jgi:hypothetical protein
MRSQEEALGFSGSVPQLSRPLGSAKRVERVGSDAGAVLGPSVVQARARLMGRNGELCGASAARPVWSSSRRA